MLSIMLKQGSLSFFSLNGVEVQICGVVSRFSHVQLFATLWTVAHQAPLSMGILQL